MRRRLLAGLALAAGCGNDRESVESRATDGIEPSLTSGSGTSTGTGVVESDGNGEDRPKLDLPPVVELECPRQPASTPRLTCPARLDLGLYPLFYCTDLNESGACVDSADRGSETPTDPEIERRCLPPPMGDADCGTSLQHLMCGPLPEFRDRCCYWFAAYDQHCPGRPFVVDQDARLPGSRRRQDWAAPVEPTVEPTVEPSPELREVVARAWLEQAAHEHASIASFSRFIMELLSCGAPADLLTSATVALGEEVEHARLFYGLASHHLGHAVGPTSLDVAGALDDRDFDRIVLSAVCEGCIAETVSAWHVRVAARSVRSSSMAAVLDCVADQELEHALLAWRFVAWALGRASEQLVERVAAAFADAELSVPRGPRLPAGAPELAMLAHGLLPPRIHALEARRALRRLVRPAAALLGLSSRSSEAAGIGVG